MNEQLPALARSAPPVRQSASRSRVFGADVVEGGVDFSVSAPKRERVTVVLEDRQVPLERDARGRFRGFARGVGAGARYQLRLDDDEALYPDPASRFQPEGPHGPSMVVDPSAYAWRDADHRGVTLAGSVLYEMHIGTFTPGGTYLTAMPELARLAALGITTIELMPLADFPGEFGWGYDGVNLFAPCRLYGTPDDLRAFVDEAHAQGLGIILDVVYNHLGPDGNFLPQFSDTFFSKKTTDWGICINFDGEGSEDVRAFYLDNAAYWIEEFHLDGLRLDATQDIHDFSPKHILVEVIERARTAARPRTILVVAENEPQEASYVRPVTAGGKGCDALWNDDFHHSAIAAATGRSEAYYSDTPGAPQELISALKWGYLYQGQHYTWQKQSRGQPALDVEAPHFVLYLQNHDQVANSARGLRLHALTSPGRARALKALLLLAPGTPMLFQGEELDASTPFFYFADHRGPLGDRVRDGRIEFLAQFPSLRDDGITAQLAPPGARETFLRSKLDPREVETHHAAYALTRDLLALRKRDFAAQRADRMHGAVLGPEAFALRFLGESDRLVLVNLGRDLELRHAPEPLLAPPAHTRWAIRLSTEDARYGGAGIPPLDAQPHLRLMGHSVVVLAPEAK